RFWTAAREGDVETVRALSFETESASLDVEPGRSAIREYTLGTTRVDGEEAFVETTVRGTDETPVVVTFETVLVKRDGDWKVDLERTGERMMKAALEQAAP
ncbi:MAG: hypothetical protein ACRELC_06220, partial [Gemmatimonadota bacterium]